MFAVANFSTSSFYVSYYDFDCYADGLACSYHHLWLWNTGEIDELAATVSPDNLAFGYVCFEVPDDADEIIIEYEYDFVHDKRLKFVYEGEKTADNLGD